VIRRRFPRALLASLALLEGARVARGEETTVVIESDGWRLVGDLRLPDQATGPVPAVVLLHGAARNRGAHAELARHLSSRGIASLRLDLRAHGESTNRGRFVPGEEGALALLEGTPQDVVAAHRYFEGRDGIDATRVAFVGASYSGEAMAEAGRLYRKGSAYVALSPGSLSDESIAEIDPSGIPWLYLRSRDERRVTEVTDAVQKNSRAEVWIVAGSAHGSDLVRDASDLSERIAVWLAARLLR
jgi:dienelactone hydrolase